MAKPYDATLKQMLDDFASDWIASFASALGLPNGPLEVLDPESSTVQVAADKVFRLPHGAGILHLEAQANWDGELPDRVVKYSIYLHDQYGGPVHSVVFLLRPEANATSITGVVTRTRIDGRPLLIFHYDVIRVWELSADQLINGNIGTMALALLTDDAGGRLPELVQRFAERAENEVPDQQLRDRLLTEGFILMGLRYDKPLIQSLFHGVQKMKESSTYQGILEEGVEKGLEKGRGEGRVEGLRLSLVTLLEQKFGSVPPSLEAQIQQTQDAGKLQAALRQVLTLARPEDLVL
jgi:predicted transposase YdaD